MTKLLIILACFTLLLGCHSNQPLKKVALSNQKAKERKEVDTIVPLDEDNPDPSFDEVKSELLARYNTIEHIDTTLIIDKDSLHIHEKYYCLKDNAVIVPKKYLWGGDTTKDFVTHSFVSHIVIIKNEDTIINKVFKKGDFDPVISPEERKYAIIMFPHFDGYKKSCGCVSFGYSITIPLTDVGVAASIAVDMNGHYRMLDEYAKIDEN